MFQKFAKGSYNLLIATKSAEDLNIPKASIVIRYVISVHACGISDQVHCRYDLIESQTSDAFVRARTRGRESHLLFMVEHGNDAHRTILADSIQLDPEVQAWTDHLFQDIGSSVPPVNLRETTNAYHSESEDEESDGCISDPTTGGRIYPQDAIAIVYRIAAGFGGSDGGQSDSALFEFTESRSAPGAPPTYVCAVRFPSGAPIVRVTGPSCATITQARRTACYQACTELLDRNRLDYRLFPLPTYIKSPRVDDAISRQMAEAQSIGQIAMENQRVQAEPKAPATQCYPRKKAAFWNFKPRPDYGQLHPIIISVDSFADAIKAHGPMLILTRQPVPSLTDFKVFFSGAPATVNVTQGASFEVNEEQLEDLHGYTLRVCRAIMNKAFTCDSKKMPYFFAPLSPSWKVQKSNQHKQWNFPNVSDHIPWELIVLAADSWAVPLASRNIRAMKKDVDDAIVQDRWVEFTRRYDVVRIRPDLTPLSKPEDSDVSQYSVPSPFSTLIILVARG